MSNQEDGAVKIAVRERPFNRTSLENVESIVNYHSTNKNIIIVNERPYEFDHCLAPNVTQKQLYDECVKPLVQKTLHGYFCTALAYGQTGTGKTFTMGLHSEHFNGDDVGMIPRSLEDVFKLSDNCDGLSQEICVSFVEIYNEKVYDLLAKDTSEQVNTRGFKFGGGKRKSIKNAQEGFEALTQGNKCRHIRPTKMNPESSRSHAIFTIHITRKTEHTQIDSLLHLVDLAGSEGVRRTGHQGIALTEGIHINQGLLSIGKVLQALAAKRKVIPYRDSVLSSVLQDSLKSNSYLTLLACISPYQEDLSETVSTLRFAADAKSLRHTPQINSILLELKKNRVKTPYKSFQLPIRPLYNNGQEKTPNGFRSSMDVPISTIKRPHHANTFCTPNKIRKVQERTLNQTDIGLTPKEKIKFGRMNSKLDVIQSVLPINNQQSKDRHNESIDSRSSIFSMNVSTSTLLDMPAATSVNSYSPIIRRCDTLETKVEQMLDMMKIAFATNKENDPKQSVEIKSACNDVNGFSWMSTNKKSANIVCEKVLSITTNAIIDKTQKNKDALSEDLSHHTTPSFAQSSPVFKMPETRKRLSYREKQNPLSNTMKLNTLTVDQTGDTMFFESTHIEDNNETVVAVVKRTSRRFSQKPNISAQPIRRSIRIERRESIRRSISIERRESLEENITTVQLPRKRLNKVVPVNNETIAQYFKPKCKTTTPKTKKQSKDAHKKHEQGVLDLLNSGSIRELQILPQIGLKTAYQIITQRTLNGRFKSFDHVSKLPIWRGKAWERFKVANNIA